MGRNGFVMSDVVSLRTLVVKIPGLMLSVAAGRAHFWADFADIFYFQLPLFKVP